MTSASDTASLNRMLASHGLGTLDDRGTLAQLGYLVDGHEHFRSLLMRCAPEMRREMYEAMRPYLRFEARPLDVYMSECADLAERKQLPTIGADGKLVPYRTVELRSSLEQAVDAADPRLKHSLTLTCAKCTREETFPGISRTDAIYQARMAGWVYFERTDGTACEICPDCPGGKAS